MREFHKRPANGVSELDNLLIEEFGVDAFPDAPAHTITLQVLLCCDSFNISGRQGDSANSGSLRSRKGGGKQSCSCMI